jgi:uncharacterized protein (DUF1015 family)
MAAVSPFRALRPAPLSASRVAAVPYDVVSAAEARALADGNPLSFLHVSRAEIDLPEETDPFADAVYARAVRNFRHLTGEAPLVREDTPSLYVYRLRHGDHAQTGVAATWSVDEYEGDTIRKHEHTRRDKEDDRTRHVIDLRAQTGPVFLTYREAPAVDQVVARTMRQSSLYDFKAPDGVQHTVWRVEAADGDPLREAFDAVPALYIADGHHRAASAARARRQLAGPDGAQGPWDWFLAVAFPDAQVRILAYNRVVTDLGPYTPETLLAALASRFEVHDGPAVPERRGEVACFLDGAWRTIVFGEPTASAAAVDRLDVSRLQDGVLAPMLGIEDPRSDRRIDFVGGARGTAELEARVRAGGAGVAFSLHPVSVAELMAISDAGGTMPPKSTRFEPKLRDGLLSHVI